MAKFHLDRLQKKYENIPVKGETYKELMSEIISHQSERITRKIVKVDESGWKKALGKIKPKEKVLIPDVSEVLPKQSVFIRKGADRGDLLRDTLRDRLTNDLRQSIEEWNEQRDRGPKILRVFRRGKRIDVINPELIKSFEKNIKSTFDGYTKKDPAFGMPSNIHTIAVTEVRSTVNEIKNQYAEKVLKDNPDVEISKEWRHNKSLSSEYRPGHLKMNKTKTPLTEMFDVESYAKKKGKWVFTGITKMKYPHDPDAPASEVIGCNCDYVTRIRRKKIEKKIKKSLTSEIDVNKKPNMNKTLKIKMAAHPYRYDEDVSYFAVEKADAEGRKRRYLRGIGTGVAKDVYGESLTVDCINSILKQSEERDILFYMEPHGITATKDLGILDNYKVLDNKDLFFEARLYDQQDGVPESKLNEIDVLWKQVNGLPPYKQKRKIGFSIEGLTNGDNLESYRQDDNGNIVERVIKDMDLIGVVICSRPAYTASIVSGVYKSLGILPPEMQKDIKKSIEDKLLKLSQIEKSNLGYHDKKWQLDNAFNDMAESIMKSNHNKQEELDYLFDGYKDIYINLLIKSEGIFKDKNKLQNENLILKRRDIIKKANFLVNKVIENRVSLSG